MAFPVVQRRGSLVPRVNPQDFVVDVSGAVDNLSDTITEVAKVAQQNRQQEFQNQATTRKLDLLEAQGERAATAHTAEMNLKGKEIERETLALEMDREKFIAEGVLRNIRLDREKISLKNEQAQNTEDMIAGRAELARADNQLAQMDTNNLMRGKQVEQQVKAKYGAALANAEMSGDIDTLANLWREIGIDFGPDASLMPLESALHPSNIKRRMGQDKAVEFDQKLRDIKLQNLEESTEIVDEINKIQASIDKKGEDQVLTKASLFRGGFKPDATPGDIEDPITFNGTMAGFFENLEKKADVALKSTDPELRARRRDIRLVKFIAGGMRTNLFRGTPPNRHDPFGGGAEESFEWDMVQDIGRLLTSDNEKDKRVGRKMLDSYTSFMNSRVEGRFARRRRERQIQEVQEILPLQRRMGVLRNRLNQIGASNPRRTEHIQTIRDERIPQGQVGARGTATLPTVRTPQDKITLGIKPGDHFIDGTTGQPVVEPPR